MAGGSLVSASIKVDPYFHIQLLKRPACKNLFSQTALLSDCTGKQSYFSNRPSYVTARENIFSQTGLLKVHLEVLYHVSLLTIQFFFNSSLSPLSHLLFSTYSSLLPLLSLSFLSGVGRWTAIGRWQWPTDPPTRVDGGEGQRRQGWPSLS